LNTLLNHYNMQKTVHKAYHSYFVHKTPYSTM